MLGLTKEQEKEMAESERILDEERMKEFEKDKKILKSVKKQVSSKLYKEIEYEIGESEGGFNFKIVDKPNGEYQNCNDDKIKVWVDQTMNGGYSGDSFAGSVYVELPNKKYLAWDYSM